MKIHLNNFNKRLFIISFSLLASGYTAAACKVTQGGESLLLSVPSISLYENGQESKELNSGLACTGLNLSLLSDFKVKYRVELLPIYFTNRLTGDKLYVNYKDFHGHDLAEGETVDLSQFKILNFFTGTKGEIPFRFNIPAGQNLSPGIYTSPVPLQIRWFYAVPALAVGGIGIYHRSPGFIRGIRDGAGELSQQALKIEVLPDCRILTNDINFGTEAFISNFEPIQTSMGIRCSSKTPYKVSLNNGLYAQNGNQRAMKSTTSNQFINYEIYKNKSNERWGLGNESWSSSDATSNPGVYDGFTQQNYMFTTKILENNPDNLPAGLYEDIVKVEVSF